MATLSPTHNSLSENNFLLTESYACQSGLRQNITDSLYKELNIDIKIAAETAKKILFEQEKLTAGEALKVNRSSAIPYDLVLTKDRIHVFKAKVGEGSFSHVYKTIVIPTRRHQLLGEHFSPGKPSTRALKMTKRQSPECPTFSPEKRSLQAAVDLTTEGVDAFLETFKDREGFGYSLNELYDQNLSKAQFDTLPHPIVSMLKVLLPCARALRHIHRSGYVHRDIKGGNILVLHPKEDSSQEVKNQITGAISDFGFLNRVQKEAHRTNATPEYLDPTQFGTQEETLCNQKKRVGTQTSAGDVYALGMTIHRDVIIRFLAAIAEQLPDINLKNLVEKLRSSSIKGPFTVGQLKEFGKKSYFRTVYAIVYIDKKPQEILVQCPSIAKIIETVTACASLLETITTLSNEERHTLIELSKLSCLMQDPDLAIRPTMDKVVLQMEKLLNLLEPQPQGVKRRLEAQLDGESFPKKEGEKIAKREIEAESIEAHQSSSFPKTEKDEDS